MKAQNTQERTRSILRFVGLFLLATVLAGSTFYFPMRAHVHSYDKIMAERNGLSQQMERDVDARKSLRPMVDQLYFIQTKTDTLLDKMKQADPEEMVALKNQLSDVQADADERRKLYRKLLKDKPVAGDSIFYRVSDFFEMSSADKATIAAQLADLTTKPKQNRVAELEQENDALKDKIDDLRAKLSASAGGGGGGGAESPSTGKLLKKIESYQAKLQRIERNAEVIRGIVKDIDSEKTEESKGRKRYYRIDDMTEFSTRISRIEDVCGTISDETR